MVSLYAMGMPTYHFSKKVHKLSIGTCIYVHYYISYSIFISLFPVMKKSLVLCVLLGVGVLHVVSLLQTIKKRQMLSDIIMAQFLQ